MSTFYLVDPDVVPAPADGEPQSMVKTFTDEKEAYSELRSIAFSYQRPTLMLEERDISAWLTIWRGGGATTKQYRLLTCEPNANVHYGGWQSTIPAEWTEVTAAA
ncbi:MAG: hypothetical protein EBQ80_04165 [Proteobacteria bacterium]|nr:hypothetical protein [Pseudomonadota bacterium]